MKERNREMKIGGGLEIESKGKGFVNICGGYNYKTQKTPIYHGRY